MPLVKKWARLFIRRKPAGVIASARDNIQFLAQLPTRWVWFRLVKPLKWIICPSLTGVPTSICSVRVTSKE